MNGKLNVFAVGVLGLVVGLVGGFYVSDAVRARYLGDLGDRAVIDLRSTLANVATTNGQARSPQEAKAFATQLLALKTISVGQAFDKIHDEHLRNEAVRMIGLIDRNGELQPNSETEAWARDVRHCIAEKAAQPDDVVACVNAAPNAPKAIPQA